MNAVGSSLTAVRTTAWAYDPPSAPTGATAAPVVAGADGGVASLAISGVDAANMANIVLAYEPIWAIGTGKNASGAVAQNVIGGTIRATLIDLYGDAVAQTVRIQYGGSVKPENMQEYMGQPDIDGALVGGASLKVNDFAALIEAAAKVKGV